MADSHTLIKGSLSGKYVRLQMLPIDFPTINNACMDNGLWLMHASASTSIFNPNQNILKPVDNQFRFEKYRPLSILPTLSSNDLIDDRWCIRHHGYVLCNNGIRMIRVPAEEQIDAWRVDEKLDEVMDVEET